MAWAGAKKRLQRYREAKANVWSRSWKPFCHDRESHRPNLRRILQGEQVSVFEKIVNLFEEHTDIIRRDKESRPVEYECKIWLNKVEGGWVSNYRILGGDPSDEQQWRRSLKAHLKTFYQYPQAGSRSRSLPGT